MFINDIVESIGHFPDKMNIIRGKFTELFDKIEVLINQAKEDKALPVDHISAEVTI